MDQLISTATGSQWVADFTDCKCDIAILESAAMLADVCQQIIVSSRLQVVGKVFHQFMPVGATGLFLLAESHLAINTWPEFSSVAIDLYVCNVEENNAAKADTVFKQLVELFDPQHYTHQVIRRGMVRERSDASANA